MQRIELARWSVAGVAGAWVAGFNWSEPRGTILAVPLVVAGVAALPRAPRTGAALVVTAGLITLAAGTSWGNVDMVLPFAITLFAVGRAEERTWPGSFAILLTTLCSALRDGFTVNKFAVTIVLHAGMWFYGVVVRRRALGAYQAVAEGRSLALEDPAEVSSHLAVEERSRLANEALFVLRAAIIRMGTAAREAASGLDPDVVHEVHDRGASAVEELRQLLGLLREPESHTSTSDRLAPVPRWRADVALAAGLAVFLTMVLVVTRDQTHSFGGMVLYAGTVVAMALRRTVPAVACSVSTFASIVAALDPPTTPDTLLPAAAGYALLTWTVTSRTAGRAWICLGLLAMSGLWVSTAYGPRGVGFVLLIFAATALVGHAWSEHDKILREAENRSERIQERLDQDTKVAVRAERLRLARELHDLASHSVGAMVLQAGAARVLCERDPAAARAALRTVITTGDEALSDVDELLVALDSGDLGTATRSYAHPGQLRTVLEELVDGMLVAGMDVEAYFGELPQSPALAATTFRVVQEGLTNAARYAPGAAVKVTVTQDQGDYVVCVSDNGCETRGAMGSGFGIAGLRERVEACAGRFTAGARSDRGFLVEARLPMSGGRMEFPP